MLIEPLLLSMNNNQVFCFIIIYLQTSAYENDVTDKYGNDWKTVQLQG